MLFLDIGQNYRKYGPAVTSHDLYKFFAIMIMVVDHVGYIFFPDQLWWRAVGRLCVPVWLFLAGYARPARPQQEFYWLCVMMVLADLYVGEALLPINILLTILVSRLFIAYADTLKHDAAALITLVTIALVLLPVTSLLFEYGSIAFLWALAGYYYRAMPESKLAPISMLVAWLAFCITQSFGFKFSPMQITFISIGCGLSALLMTHYRICQLEGTEQSLWGMAVKFIGRNSHYVYAAHFIAFLLLRHFLQEPASTPIRWIK